MRTLTIPSAAVALRSDQLLTPAMVAAVWEIAAAIDKLHLPAKVEDALWLEVPTIHLRGKGARSDNVWLRECLERLTGIKLSGEDQGDPWGAVVLAEWRIINSGQTARLLIPPAGVNAFRAPAIFAKIEATAAHRLSGHAKQLYALLADKKRLSRPNWTFTLEELKALMGVAERGSYARFNTFRQRVLDPATQAINDYGTVAVQMTPVKIGRSVVGVRFDWRWKDAHSAAQTAAENDRHSQSRRKVQESADAPPMIETAPPHSPRKKPDTLPSTAEEAMAWWGSLSDTDRSRWSDLVGREIDLGLGLKPRPERAIALDAYMRLHEPGSDSPEEPEQ